MNPQGAFLLRTKSAFNRRTTLIVQAEKIATRYHAIRRETGRQNVGGLTFVNSEFSGKYDHKTIDIMNVRNYAFRFALTAAGIKSVLRRLRPQEAARLQEIDDETERLKQRIKELGDQRKLVLHEAFERGHVVTVAEVRAAAEAQAALEETVEP